MCMQSFFNPSYIQTPSIDSTLSSIADALELLPEISPKKNRSYAKDGQLEFNTMEVYPSAKILSLFAMQDRTAPMLRSIMQRLSCSKNI